MGNPFYILVGIVYLGGLAWGHVHGDSVRMMLLTFGLAMISFVQAGMN